jgi:hypothetical protein
MGAIVQSLLCKEREHKKYAAMGSLVLYFQERNQRNNLQSKLNPGGTTINTNPL